MTQVLSRDAAPVVAGAAALARSDLHASRLRLVTAADSARQRFARDLHDGAQQRFVAAIIELQTADRRFDADPDDARRLMRKALARIFEGLDQLRDLAAGLHPRVLTSRGIRAATEVLARGASVPVIVDATDARYPAPVEAGAYFVVAEALTNAARHTEATEVRVDIHECGGDLVVDVRDDGWGGADSQGTGLRGLADRVEALGGRFLVDSPAGIGTRLHATIPID